MASTTAIRAGRAFVELFTDNSKLIRGLREAEMRVRDFGNKMKALGMKLSMIGAVAAVPLGLATKVFADFDDQMRAVSAVTGATETEFESLTEKAKLLGRTTSYTAAQVAGAMLELGRAGFDPTEIDAAIAGMLDLARATGTDLAEATIYAGNVLRSFNLPATEMTRVCDVMVATANNSAQTLTDLGESMSYCAPIAAEYGLSLEQTAKALGSLANYGIKGSQAGTTLRRILTNLADPAIQKKLKELKIDVVDGKTGQLRDVSDILRELGQATQTMSKDKKLGLFKELFGLYAIAGGAKLTTAQFDKLINAIDNASGTAAKTAKRMDSGIGGSFRMLLSAVEGVAIAVGEALAPSIMQVAGYFTRASEGLASYISKNKELIVTIAKVVASIIGIGIALITGGLTLLAFAKMIGLVAGSITVVANIALSGFGLIAGAIKLVTATVTTLFAVLALGATALSAVFTAVSTLASTLFAAVGTAIAAILSPVGLTITAIVALGTACYLVYQNAAAIGEVFSKAFTAITATIKKASSSVSRFFTRFTEIKIIAGLSKMIGSSLSVLSNLFLRLGRQAWQAITTIGGVFLTLGKTVVSVGASLGSGLFRGFAVVVSGIGNALSGVAQIVLNAWSGVASAFTTLFETLGSIVAGFCNFFVSAFATLGTAIDWLKTQFGNVLTFASETFSAIAQAIGRGDIEAAIQLMWASIKLIWVKGSTSLIETWYWVVNTLQTAWASCVYTLSELLVSSWYGVQEFWTETVYTMSILWTEFSSGVVSAWKKAEESIARGIGWIMAKMQGLDPAEMDTIIKEQYEQEAKTRQAQKSKDISNIQQARDSKMASLGAEKEGMIKTLQEDQKRGAEARDKTYQERISVQEAELKQAQEEYRKSMERAKQPPEVKAESGGSLIDSIKTEVTNVVKGFKTSISSYGQGTYKVAASSAGTFNPFEAVGGQDNWQRKVMEDSLRVQKEIRDNTKKEDDGMI